MAPPFVNIAEMDAARSVDNDSGVGLKNRASHCDFTSIYMKIVIRTLKKIYSTDRVSNFVERLMYLVTINLFGPEFESENRFQHMGRLRELVYGICW